MHVASCATMARISSLIDTFLYLYVRMSVCLSLFLSQGLRLGTGEQALPARARPHMLWWVQSLQRSLSVSLSVCLCLPASMNGMHACTVWVHVCMHALLSLSLSVSLSLSLSVSVRLCPSLSVSPCLCPSADQSVSPSVCLCMCMTYMDVS